MAAPYPTSINVSLPSPLKDFVRTQIRTGAYGSASEYIRMLIRDARERVLIEEGARGTKSNRSTPPPLRKRMPKEETPVPAARVQIDGGRPTA